MELRRDPNGPELAWDLKAESMVKMIAQAREICEAHNRKFTPRDVLVWESPENLAKEKKAEKPKPKVERKEK
jgi:hypothetical protein